MTHAPARMLRQGAAVLGCSCALATCFGPHVLAQDDDWSLSRPAARGARAGVAGAAREQDTPGHALQRALANPLEASLVQRLFAAFLERDGDLTQLEQELVARTATTREQRSSLLLLAALEVQRGNTESAREFFARADALRPDAEVLQAWARFEGGAGRVREQRALLERALRAPQSQAARTRLSSELAGVALALGDLAGARDYFMAAARANPGNLAHALAFARALAAHGDHAPAAEAYAAVVAGLRGDPRVLPPLLLELASLQLAAAHPDEALSTLRRAQRLVGAGAGLHAEILERLYQVFDRLGRLGEFAQELASERGADAAALRARIYEQLGQPSQALAALRQLLARQPDDVANAERVIALLWQQGRVADVIAEYERLLRVTKGEARYATELCQLLLQAGRRGEALAMLAKLGRDNPRDVRLHETIADLYTRFHEPEAAHAELQLLAKLQPADAERFVTLGEAELARGNKDAARAAFRRVAQGQLSAVAHLRLAQVYLDHEFPTEALAEYDQARKLRPTDGRVARGRAETLARLFRYKEALAEWERALALAGSDPALRRDARKELVGMWDELAQLKQHIAQLEQLCSDWPRDRASHADKAPACDAEQARTLVEAYERMARHGGLRADPTHYMRAAQDMLARIVVAEPRDLESLLALERLHVKRGNLDGAVAVLEQLIHADPDNQRTYLERMVSYALARYHDAEAELYAQRAVAAAPDDALAQERLGDLYRARNDMPRALASYERALALDPARFGLALRIAQHELAIGNLAAAEQRLHSVIVGSQDDDLVLRALHSALQLVLPEARLAELEHALLPLALREPPRPVYRHALLELYAVLVPLLSERARGQEPEADRARLELAAIGRRAVKPLLAALSDTDASQVREAISLLAALGNAGTAQALLALAESRADVELRRDALRAAALLGGSELTERWLTLARAKEARLQVVAVWGLARGQSPAAVEALTAIADDPAPALRSYALLGLARRGTPDALPRLQRALLHDRSPFVRVAAALGLGMLGDPAAAAVLASCSAQTQEPALAEAATLALGMLGDARPSAALATRLFSTLARVRDAAELALRVLRHGERVLLELPAPLDRSDVTDLLRTAHETLAQLPRHDLTRYVAELRSAAGQALRADDASKLAVLAFLAKANRTPPAAASSDPRELGLDLRHALLVELSLLRAHPDRGMRLALVKALSNTPSREAAALLMDLTEDRTDEVRGAALAMLSEQTLSEQPGWAERLSRRAVSEAAFWLRQHAVLALARLPSSVASRTLARVLQTDAYALVRESAVQSLAGRDVAIAGPALRAALRDPEPRVSAAAVRALRSTGGESLRAARSDLALPAAVRELLRR